MGSTLSVHIKPHETIQSLLKLYDNKVDEHLKTKQRKNERRKF